MLPEVAAAQLLEGRVPDAMVVDGTLSLDRSSMGRGAPAALSAWPRRLEVTGDLILRGWRLGGLPESLSVGGTLDLRDCGEFQTLPSGLKAAELRLHRCESLIRLHPDMQVPDLAIGDCPALEEIPPLDVEFLSVSGCPVLEELPERLHVRQDLRIHDCPAFRGFSTTVLADKWLVINKCPRVESVDFTVWPRLVILVNCVSLEMLPHELRRAGRLEIRDCPRLAQLPRVLEVEYSLDLSGCTALEALPDSLAIGLNLTLNACTGLKRLPANLAVPGDADFSGCRELTTLPPRMVVGGDLNVTRCDRLASLPGTLTVMRRLIVDRPIPREPGLQYESAVWGRVAVPDLVIWNPDQIEIGMIEEEPNVEVRRILIDRYGAARFLQDSGAAEIDRIETTEIQGLRGAILYRKDMGDREEPIVMVAVQNSTAESDGAYKRYWLRVPPQVQTCREAVAWTFGMSESNYRPTLET
jgi:hypothetical protein